MPVSKVNYITKLVNPSYMGNKKFNLTYFIVDNRNTQSPVNHQIIGSIMIQ